MAPELFCFSDATRLGWVDVVPLIQIKQIRTGGTHCAREKVCKPARFRFGERTLSEQDSSDGPASSALLPRPRERDRCADGGDGHFSGCRPRLGRDALFAIA